MSSEQAPSRMTTNQTSTEEVGYARLPLLRIYTDFAIGKYQHSKGVHVYRLLAF